MAAPQRDRVREGARRAPGRERLAVLDRTTPATTASGRCSPRTSSAGWRTPSRQLAKVVKPGSGDVAKQQAQLLDRLVKVLDTPLENGGGTLNVLRKGFSHISAKFQMCQFKPESTLNPKTVERLRSRCGCG